MQIFKTNDFDLISQYSKNFGDFRTMMGPHIQCHIKVIATDAAQQLYNEQFEMQMGINVKERTIKEA